MNEGLPADAATPPVLDTHLIPEQPPATSIADHASRFGPNATPDGDEPPADAAATVVTPHPSSTQRREQDGQFRTGRHRARSQQASPEDVPRIRELTAKQRAAEEENTRLKAELETLRRQPRQEPTPPAAARVDQPSSPARGAQPAAAGADPGDPRPDKADAAKYPDGIYDPQYVEDLSEWKARGVWRAEKQKEATAAAEKTWYENFGTRVTAARAKYQDFDAVALAQHVEVPIPEGSPTDAFIMDDDNGADVLYHLRRNPGELKEILAMPPLKQLRRLSLLSQRFDAPPSRAQAGTTGAAATHIVAPVPRPPTPVRTGAHSVSDGPPSDGRPMSIKDHEKFWGPKAARR